MGILYTIFIGFFVGLFARALMPGRDIKGFIMTTLLGIGGALFGKFIERGLGMTTVNGESAGFFMSLIGAMMLLFLYDQFNKRS